MSKCIHAIPRDVMSCDACEAEEAEQRVAFLEAALKLSMETAEKANALASRLGKERDEALATVERHNQRCVELLEEKLSLLERVRQLEHTIAEHNTAKAQEQGFYD